MPFPTSNLATSPDHNTLAMHPTQPQYAPNNPASAPDTIYMHFGQSHVPSIWPRSASKPQKTLLLPLIGVICSIFACSRAVKNDANSAQQRQNAPNKPRTPLDTTYMHFGHIHVALIWLGSTSKPQKTLILPTSRTVLRLSQNLAFRAKNSKTRPQYHRETVKRHTSSPETTPPHS